MKLLLWYIMAFAMFGPLLLGPFTLGNSLLLYPLMFSIPEYFLYGAVFPGLIFWTIHQFIQHTAVRPAKAKHRATVLPPDRIPRRR